MATESPYRFVYVTAPDRAQALKIGRALVERRLIACANVLTGMTAVYWWKDRIEEGDEAVLIAKTTADQVEAVIAAVKELHEYECPCVIALPIESGLAEYLQWIRDETR